MTAIVIGAILIVLGVVLLTIRAKTRSVAGRSVITCTPARSTSGMGPGYASVVETYRLAGPSR
jgi:dipeptide/tripeptide permease